LSVPPDVLAAIRGARSILCATHSPMDGDGLGCGLALKRAFEATGKKVVLVTEAPVPSVYAFLPGYESIVGSARSRSPART
jgi:nanoRNase/pAp phosphatase (c-di-AMP/oligoRNAs hydrolase)